MISYLWCIVVVSFSISFNMVSSEGRVDKPALEKTNIHIHFKMDR